MNEIVNMFLLAGDKLVPEMHLKQSEFTYSACGPFTETKERILKFKETGDRNYIYKNEFDKACFQHNMAYGDLKDLARRTTSDKVLKDKAFNIANNPKYDEYRSSIFGFTFLDRSLVYKFFDKKTSGSCVNTHENNERSLELAT